MIPTEALILLDTNILVHLIRGDVVGQRLAVDYDLFKRPQRPLISFVTVGEMYALARKRGWETKRRQTLETLLTELVVVNIHQSGIVEAYAEIDYFSEKVVKPACQMGKNDM